MLVEYKKYIVSTICIGDVVSKVKEQNSKSNDILFFLNLSVLCEILVRFVLKKTTTMRTKDSQRTPWQNLISFCV